MLWSRRGWPYIHTVWAPIPNFSVGVVSLSLLVQSSTGHRPQAGLGIFTSPKLNSFTFGVFPGGQEDCIYDSLEGKLSLWF